MTDMSTKHDQHTRHARLSRAVSVSLWAMMAWLISSPAQSAATDVSSTAAARNFEGVWLSVRERSAPAPGAPAATVTAPGGTSLREVQLSGSTLQCTPVLRLNGGGGGMSTLIVQSDRQLMMVSEEDMDFARKVYIGGAHPPADQLVPQPNGHSIGHWEGNTLVVDTIGYSSRDGKDNGQHVVERISRNDNTLTSEVVVTDKNGNSRKQTLNWASRPGLQFNENVCEEGFDRYQVINGQLDNPNIPPNREGE